MLSFTPRPTAARKGSYTAARNTPFSPLSDLTLPKGASTSLSGPIREVEREVDETQARAQKNKTSPLEVLFRRLVVTLVLFPGVLFSSERGG